MEEKKKRVWLFTGWGGEGRGAKKTEMFRVDTVDLGLDERPISGSQVPRPGSIVSKFNDESSFNQSYPRSELDLKMSDELQFRHY